MTHACFQGGGDNRQHQSQDPWQWQQQQQWWIAGPSAEAVVAGLMCTSGEVGPQVVPDHNGTLLLWAQASSYTPLAMVHHSLAPQTLSTQPAPVPSPE